MGKLKSVPVLGSLFGGPDLPEAPDAADIPPPPDPAEMADPEDELRKKRKQQAAVKRRVSGRASTLLSESEGETPG